MIELKLSLYICDGCNDIIPSHKARIHCEECPDYDCCANCYVVSIYTKNHTAKHVTNLKHKSGTVPRPPPLPPRQSMQWPAPPANPGINRRPVGQRASSATVPSPAVSIPQPFGMSPVSGPIPTTLQPWQVPPAPYGSVQATQQPFGVPSPVVHQQQQQQPLGRSPSPYGPASTVQQPWEMPPPSSYSSAPAPAQLLIAPSPVNNDQQPHRMSLYGMPGPAPSAQQPSDMAATHFGPVATTLQPSTIPHQQQPPEMTPSPYGPTRAASQTPTVQPPVIVEQQLLGMPPPSIPITAYQQTLGRTPSTFGPGVVNPMEAPRPPSVPVPATQQPPGIPLPSSPPPADQNTLGRIPSPSGLVLAAPQQDEFPRPPSLPNAALQQPLGKPPSPSNLIPAPLNTKAVSRSPSVPNTATSEPHSTPPPPSAAQNSGSPRPERPQQCSRPPSVIQNAGSSQAFTQQSSTPPPAPLQSPGPVETYTQPLQSIPAPSGPVAPDQQAMAIPPPPSGPPPPPGPAHSAQPGGNAGSGWMPLFNGSHPTPMMVDFFNAVFARLDTNRSGLLTPEQYSAFCDAQGYKPEEDVWKRNMKPQYGYNPEDIADTELRTAYENFSIDHTLQDRIIAPNTDMANLTNQMSGMMGSTLSSIMKKSLQLPPLSGGKMPMLTRRGFVEITTIETICEPSLGWLRLNRIAQHYGVWREWGDIPREVLPDFAPQDLLDRIQKTSEFSQRQAKEKIEATRVQMEIQAQGRWNAQRLTDPPGTTYVYRY